MKQTTKVRIFRRLVRPHCKILKTLCVFFITKIELPVACATKCEMCVVIHFLYVESQPSVRIHERLMTTVYVAQFISTEMVRKWYHEFVEGTTKYGAVYRVSY